MNSEEIPAKQVMSEECIIHDSGPMREEKDIMTISLAPRDLIGKELIDQISESNSVSIHASAVVVRGRPPLERDFILSLNS
jgi:hypothetical protein